MSGNDGAERSIETQGKDYKEINRNHQFIYGKEFLDSLPLKPTYHVLDMGCGTGDLAEYVAKNKVQEGRVTAFDPDKQRIKIARDNCNGIQNLSFHEGKASEFLKDKHNIYDVIYSNVVLHWIPEEDLVPTFTEIYSSLKPGGITAHQYAEKEPEYSIDVRGLMEKDDHAFLDSLFHPLKPEYIDEVAVKCGFVILRHEKVIHREEFPDFHEFFKWLEATCHGRIPFKKRYDHALATGKIAAFHGKVEELASNVSRVTLRKPDL